MVRCLAIIQLVHIYPHLRPYTEIVAIPFPFRVMADEYHLPPPVENRKCITDKFTFRRKQRMKIIIMPVIVWGKRFGNTHFAYNTSRCACYLYSIRKSTSLVLHIYEICSGCG